MKIAYCTDSLNHLGGIQRVTTVKASALAAIPGNEIHILTAEGEGKSIFPLDPRVKVTDLDVRYYSDDWRSTWHLIVGTISRRRTHRARLRKALAEIAPDVVVSTGTSDKFFLPCIAPRETVVVREIHFFSRYRRLFAHGLLGRLRAILGDIVDYKITIRRYDRLYLLTAEDRLLWRNDPRVGVMPNPNSFTPRPVPTSGREKKVISVGRYSSQKRFDNLLRIWSRIANRFPDWRLEIWGEGELHGELTALTETLGIGRSASLMGATDNVERELSTAAIFALTSDLEGFPLVIVEAMSCGVVPVSFACPTGPSDIITDGEDGFLIPPGDLDLFAGRLAWLMSQGSERERMARAARRRAEDFTPDKIARRWMDEFEWLAHEKNLKKPNSKNHAF
jgi:glycosyltransferase involved in cell wall biosynthesis